MASGRDGGESPTPGLSPAVPGESPAVPGESEQKAAASPEPALVLRESRLRKFFVLRPGMFEQALADITAQIDQQADGEVQSTWLLTEVDHWNNEKERIVMITENSLIICKYDFVMLSFESCRKVPLNYIDKMCYGQLTFPEYSISRKEAHGLRIHWDKLREASFFSRWNPWSNEIPYTTFIEHPVKGANEMFTSICQLENFKDQLARAVQRAYEVEPVPGRANGLIILDRPIPIETYIGVISLISNQNKLGYSLARGSVGF
ncbi:tumor protein p63-regulated gene 1 protein [Pristis pectinata]|uniref:tumor protein p63-regulated gene 1 protein n=1 Tax=Pristis pectinata TaxID=685728 RepID=UPI00223D2DE6|nr:tumor protein p63-regulated gene 1 protein [Pristis pectinata]